MEKRVKFDFEIFFTNGGSIKGEDFRLDISGDDISESALADYIVEDMQLIMVGKVNILNKEILIESHKRKPIDESVVEDSLIDLSHTIEDGLITYKGLPAPHICDYLSREQSKHNYDGDTSFQIGKIEMVTNTGTYIDCPFHRFADGNDTAQTALKSFAELDAVMIHIPFTETLKITEDHLKNREIRNRAVLIQTGWDKHWNTEQVAMYLRDCNVKLVGIDSHNIDDTAGRTRPVHTLILSAGILIVEHLCNLNKLPDHNFKFTAAPPKFKGVGTFPVRAFASIEKK